MKNREIKFRIWMGDKYKTYPEEHHKKNRCSHSPCMYGNVGEFGVFGFKQREDYILEQYTGLKDKNGREIYEGDIIKQKNAIKNVKWGISGWLPFEEWDDYERAGQNFDENCSVIGNIHENKDLLK